MIARPDETHDPALRSWVDAANVPGTPFPVQNLPLGAFHDAHDPVPRLGVAIGDGILDLHAARDAGLFDGVPAAVGEALGDASLDRLRGLGRGALAAVRGRVSGLLRADRAEGVRARAMAADLLVPQGAATMVLPAHVGDYTDFYASVHHATNIGSMFRPDSPLLPNYKHIPIGYHGRASSLVASGTPVRRPWGQVVANPAGPPTFAPCARLDYELEVAAWVCGENALGTPVPIAEAESRLAGITLLNDWSARDIQSWEYQPLGPFLSKGFASTVSPWLVTMDALAPFRVPLAPRAAGDPAPLPYLVDADDQGRGGIALTLEVWLRSAAMREAGVPAVRLSRGSFTDMYWTFAQLLAHHGSNGCNLRAGDLLGSGTVSGPTRESRGCLMELTWRGTEPLTLPTGESRSFLADGDELVMRGWAEGPGAVPIGLGECVGIIQPAVG